MTCCDWCFGGSDHDCNFMDDKFEQYFTMLNNKSIPVFSRLLLIIKLVL